MTVVTVTRNGCWLWHSWSTDHGTGKYDYQECRRCGARRVLDRQPGIGHQPIDWAWVTGQTVPGKPPRRVDASQLNPVEKAIDWQGQQRADLKRLHAD